MAIEKKIFGFKGRYYRREPDLIRGAGGCAVCDLTNAICGDMPCHGSGKETNHFKQIPEDLMPLVRLKEIPVEWH